MEDERAVDEAEDGITVPHTQLSAEALRGVVESFVLREGTDYGHHEVSFESKIAQVIGQLERGEACVVFDPHTASVDVVLTQGRSR